MANFITFDNTTYYNVDDIVRVTSTDTPSTRCKVTFRNGEELAVDVAIDTLMGHIKTGT